MICLWSVTKVWTHKWANVYPKSPPMHCLQSKSRKPQVKKLDWRSDWQPCATDQIPQMNWSSPRLRLSLRWLWIKIPQVLWCNAKKVENIKNRPQSGRGYGGTSNQWELFLQTDPLEKKWKKIWHLPIFQGLDTSKKIKNKNPAEAKYRHLAITSSHLWWKKKDHLG